MGVLLVAALATGWALGAAGVGRSVSTAALTELERRFVEQMKGATLVGTFTIAGREGGREERYVISSVEKLSGDDWRFNARIQYGKIDSTLPVVVRMVWADDTPIITMTDVALPPLGTFTARVFFYGDRYAGTWQHDSIGGHMFGRIEPSGH